MKILVTGASGFLGAALCRALVARGDQVRAFHRPTSNLHLLENLPIEHAIGDLTQPTSLYAAIDGMEVVFHAAAHLGGSNPSDRMYTTTVEGTRTLLRACRQAQVRRVIHTSSVAALGVPEIPSLPDGNPPLINEAHTWNYHPDYWPYGYTKYLAEMEVQQAIALGLDAVIVNPSVVFGTGDIHRQNNSIIVQVARHRIPALPEGGLNAVHLDDVINGHLAALERGRCGERYILGGQNITHAALIHQIASLAGVEPPITTLPGNLLRQLAGTAQLLRSFIHLPVSANDLHLAGYYFYFDTRKSQVELHLDPPKPLAAALQEALDWFKAASAI